jgi:hypothetical protein
MVIMNITKNFITFSSCKEKKPCHKFMHKHDPKTKVSIVCTNVIKKPKQLGLSFHKFLHNCGQETKACLHKYNKKTKVRFQLSQM